MVSKLLVSCLLLRKSKLCLMKRLSNRFLFSKGTIIHEMSHFTVTADTDDYAYGQSACRSLADNNPSAAINNADSHEYMAENTPSLSCNPAPAPSSCMSGDTRVNTATSNQQEEFMNVRDLSVGDTIQGLNENMNPVTCSVEAIGNFGGEHHFCTVLRYALFRSHVSFHFILKVGPTYGNYTDDHFILDPSSDVVRPKGASGEMNVVDKYAVLTSCPVGVDESGTGFTPLDSDFLGDEALAWSDYVVIHEAIYNIVKEVGPFVFWPETYTSMEEVSKYTNTLYKTMLKCAKNAKQCAPFEKAAEALLENTLTDDAKAKVKQGFGNFGKPNKPGSISAAVSKGKSVE